MQLCGSCLEQTERGGWHYQLCGTASNINSIVCIMVSALLKMAVFGKWTLQGRLGYNWCCRADWKISNCTAQKCDILRYVVWNRTMLRLVFLSDSIVSHVTNTGALLLSSQPHLRNPWDSTLSIPGAPFNNRRRSVFRRATKIFI